MAFLEGKSGAVTVGGTAIPVKSWKASYVKDELDVTNTTSSGKRGFQAGLEHVEFTLEAEWDATVHPFAAALPISSSTDNLTTVLLKVSSGSTPITMPSAFVSKIDIDMTVEGIVKYTITGKSNGTFTLAG